jgi:hypothetical protein
MNTAERLSDFEGKTEEMGADRSKGKALWDLKTLRCFHWIFLLSLSALSHSDAPFCSLYYRPKVD